MPLFGNRWNPFHGGFGHSYRLPGEQEGNVNRRLEAVEYLKAVQDCQLRRYKQVMLVVFVLGIVCGGFLFYFITEYPDAIPSLPLETTIPILSFLAENSYMMLLSVIVLMMSYASVSVMNLTQDLRRLGA